MTTDEIIEMARQTGVLAGYEGEPSYLIIFAKALMDIEREECALICENYADVDTYPDGIIHDYHSHLIRLRGKE
jgi:hypothetical protein